MLEKNGKTYIEKGEKLVRISSDFNSALERIDSTLTSMMIEVALADVTPCFSDDKEFGEVIAEVLDGLETLMDVFEVGEVTHEE